MVKQQLDHVRNRMIEISPLRILLLIVLPLLLSLPLLLISVAQLWLLLLTLLLLSGITPDVLRRSVSFFFSLCCALMSVDGWVVVGHVDGVALAASAAFIYLTSYHLQRKVSKLEITFEITQRVISSHATIFRNVFATPLD